MRKRTQSRNFALQILYQTDITHEPVAEALGNFWQYCEEEFDDEVKKFSEELVKGAVENQAKIDELISSYAVNWKIDRMSVIDRNILRLGCFELIFRQDIPPKVAINEAVELAKKYSGAEAGKFVNGILDKVKSEAKK